MKGLNMIGLDIETGGKNPKTSDILQIGICWIKDGNITHETTFNVKKDHYRVSTEALKINKINLAEERNNLYEISQIKEFIKNLKHQIYGDKIKPKVLGHNIGFDLGFIHEQVIPKDEWEELFSYRNIDTASIANFLIDSKVLPIYKSSLSTLLEYFQLGGEDAVGRHSALYDARSTFYVYQKLKEIIQK